MNKTEFVGAVAESSEFTKADTGVFVTAFLDTLTKVLASGDSVTFSGFGTFEVNDRKERKGHNPRTQEEITIPASKYVHFKNLPALKESVNG